MQDLEECYLKPFLDNKETFGDSPTTRYSSKNLESVEKTQFFKQNAPYTHPEKGEKRGNSTLLEKCNNEVFDFKAQAKHRRQRINTIASLKRGNLSLSAEAGLYLRMAELTEEEREFFKKLVRELPKCSSHCLFKEFLEDGSLDFERTFTCNQRLCLVCNFLRGKTTRAKYFSYLQKNTELLEEYDFFHLTLTVHHSKEGFKGERFYLDEFRYQFTEMRKKPFWKEEVYAGGYSFEFTRNDNGLHIHIHALLLVEKGTQNRNRLHKEILRNWNMQTVDRTFNRLSFDLETRAAIKKSNSLIDDAFINELEPQGSTLIGLESLYYFEDKKKKYADPKNLEQMMKGVMECIKYHFEPLALQKKTGEYEFDLIREIMPKIFKKHLFKKFGAFRKVKELNLSYRVKDEAYEYEKLSTTTKHPLTGEEMGRDEFTYVSANASDIYCLANDGLKPVFRNGARKKYLHHAETQEDALKIMLAMMITNSI